VLTILCTIGLGVGHWIVWLCCAFGSLFGANAGGGRAGEYVAKFQAGMTPPFVLGWVHFSSHELQEQRINRNKEFGELCAFSGIGTLCWAIAAAGLYALTSIRFRQMTNRTDWMTPEFARDGREPPRRSRPPPLPIAPWSPPIARAIMLEEAVEEDSDQPLDHDEK
jgi:hypothetical protein